MQFMNSLSKFCSFIFKNAHSKKNIVIMLIIMTFTAIGMCKAITDKLEAASIKYTTCLKLKYPPKYFFFSFCIKRYLKNSHSRPPLT